MDLYDFKNIKPMLIGMESEPFDSPDFIYELKLDGERCIAYTDDNGTELRNKRNNRMLPKFPELKDLHRQVKGRAILDGELIVAVKGRPAFSEVQRRSLMSNQYKIQLAASEYPASFVAYDILYHAGRELLQEPLMNRKEKLQSLVMESDRIAVSRYIEEKGIALYGLTEQQDLEGIVAKRRDSIYVQDKRTKDWVKCKNLKDDDYIVCGYILKEKSVTSIVLGQYGEDGGLKYKGHVTLGVSRADFETIRKSLIRETPPFDAVPPGNEAAVWLAPSLVCAVKYMEKTKSGSLRQPVFKGLRDDKPPGECIEG